MIIRISRLLVSIGIPGQRRVSRSFRAISPARPHGKMPAPHTSGREAFEPFNEIVRAVAPRFDWYEATRLGRRASLRLLKRIEVLAGAVDRSRAAADLHAAFGNCGRAIVRRQGQEPDAEEPVGLAGRAGPATARGAARGDAGAGGRGFGDRACLAAWTRVGGTRHGAPDRARPPDQVRGPAAAPAGVGAGVGKEKLCLLSKRFI